MERFWNKVDKSGYCWEWLAARSSTGYGVFTLGRCVHGAHRVAYMLSIGPIPEGEHICHVCDNRSCVNPAHLFRGTAKDNVWDMINKGKGCLAKGVDNVQARLTPEIVKNIRLSNESGPALARQYNISSTTIYHIRNYKTWKEV